MGIDPEKLFVLFVIALIVLGPERLPKMAKSLGRGLAEVRKYTSAARAEMDEVLAEPRSVIHSALQESDLEGLKDLANLRNPMRFIDATSRSPASQSPASQSPVSQPSVPQSTPEPSVSSGQRGSPVAEAATWSAVEPSDLPLPDDPSLN